MCIRLKTSFFSRLVKFGHFYGSVPCCVFTLALSKIKYTKIHESYNSTLANSCNIQKDNHKHVLYKYGHVSSYWFHNAMGLMHISIFHIPT